MSKKILCLALVLVMLVTALASCGDPEDPVDDPTDDPSVDNSTVAPVDPYAGKTHNEISDDLYEKVLGEFDEYYTAAKAETNVSKKFALMAIAEAKMLETGVMLPSTAQGGNYAISRMAPYSVPSVLWGNDSDRFYSAVISTAATPLTPAERDEMKAAWKTAADADAYLEWAKEYLTTKGYGVATTYSFGYTEDPKNWDALATSNAADSEAIVNTYDGLMEYDVKNNQAYALAESHTVSADGKTYTFKLREGINWVDFEGNVIEELTADSFVAGFQHMLDAAGGLEYLVCGLIENAEEYVYEEITDFAQVGVKAISTYEVQYTLVAPASYFMTMLGYNVFAPMSRAKYVSEGGVFGVAALAEALAAEEKTYTYGNTYQDIAYCGPYVVSSAVDGNTIIFSANDAYWNTDKVQIKTITWKFLDSNNPTESYQLMKEGTFAGAGLNDAALALAKSDNWFTPYAYVSGTDATSFPVFMNLYRAQYGNYNDETVAPTTLTDEEKVRANLAMQNIDFRMALATSLDRGAYNATVVGDELKLTSLVNSYTPGNFVQLAEAVTVKINGVDKTYAAGTYYGQIMQDQLDADEIPIKVWDPTLEGGVGSSSGYDGWYNVEYSRERLAAAVATLAAQNVEISAANPLKLEIPYYDIYDVYANRAAALEQSIEATTQGLVDIVLVKCGGSNAGNWYDATYWPESGDDMNFNLMDNSGWGPDYGDPSTYLDTMYYGGYMLKCIGIY